MEIVDILIVVLITDFVTGLVHWFEDSYGDPNWPLVGPLIFAPNLRHHIDPAAFTKRSWFATSWSSICLGAVVLAGAWAAGWLVWQVVLAVLLGMNANEIHKWNHLPRTERPRAATFLQELGILQTAQQHAQHHRGRRDTCYCAITNLVNPVLDSLRFWRALEWLIEFTFGVTKRAEPDARPASASASPRPKAAPSPAVRSFPLLPIWLRV